MVYILLIIDFIALLSMVNIYIMVYSGFGCDLRFDLDLISQGQITKLSISRLLSILEVLISMVNIYIMVYSGFG